MTNAKTKRSPGQAVKKTRVVQARTARAAKSPAGDGGAKAGERLRPGTLDGLVLDYMARHEDSGPFGQGMIAKALGRGAGATANSLVRLARDERVREVDERPLRYSFPTAACTRLSGARPRARQPCDSPPRSGR